jgi:hypothetical protein
VDQRHLFWARTAGILTFISIGIALLDYLDTTPVPVQIVSDAPQVAAIAATAAPLSSVTVPAETQADLEPVRDISPRAVEPQVEKPRPIDAPVQRYRASRSDYPQPRPSRQVTVRDPDPGPVEREIQPVQGASLEFPHVAQ